MDKKNMAEAKGKKGNGGKGFGSMDEEKQREIASRGGRASAQSNTSNRGFASMDKNKQREISSQGGKASQTAEGAKINKRSASPANDEKNQNTNDINSDMEVSQRDLNSLEEEEELGSRNKRASLAYSETDEDEDEGVGDGNLGRSTKSKGSDEEG